MARLMGLPTELLLGIFSLVVSHPDSRLIFWALSLSSKRLNALCNPFLYYEYVNIGRPVDFKPFVNTIINRPDLASRVKKVVVKGSPFMRKRDGGEVEAKLAAAIGQDFSEALRIIHEVDRLSEMMNLFMIVTHTPNLEYLGLDDHMYPTPGSTWTGMELILQKAFRGMPSTLEKLKTVDFDGRFERRPMNSVDTSGFLCLPLLETFQISGGVDLGRDPSEWKCAPRTSSVTTIRILDSQLSRGSLIQLIRSSKELKTFAITSKRHMPNQRALGQYLWEHRDTLEYINYSASGDRNHSSLVSHEKGSMRGFRKLHTLVWDQQNLGSPGRWSDTRAAPVPLVDNLPASLVSLTLKTCSVEIVPLLDAVADAHPSHLPNLKIVCVEMAPTQYSSFQTWMDPLRPALQAVSEKFAGRNVQMDYKMPTIRHE
jgi:hypothetical protein